ncbi:LysR family transcriptional regulator [Variovorax sp. HJSM1_2]|uniref:LysR family transcriptional regulator n=1 Tax=Variovorax sp. HJSM1_2 TaxID=3366263 RepID=UPI003BEE05E5
MQRSSAPLDRQMLRVLVTLLTETSLQRAAECLRQTPEAIENALHKLRRVFRDDLLQTVGTALVPTAHGLTVLESARTALWAIEDLMAESSAMPRRHNVPRHINTSTDACELALAHIAPA